MLRRTLCLLRGAPSRLSPSLLSPPQAQRRRQAALRTHAVCPAACTACFVSRRWQSDTSASSSSSFPSSSSASSPAAASAHAANASQLTKYHIQEETHTIRSSPRPFPRTPAEIIAFKKKMLTSFPQKYIRNVSIVAHVDHGKTTLTDALLRRAGLLPADGATGTFTDRLAVERERGITIKAQTCSVFLTRRNEDTGEDEEFLLNLIDTPGHVDFQYEVSRSLSASEGAALLVDVSQGVEAQTMTQFYAALEQDLTLLPVLTKLDQVLTDDVVDAALQHLEDSTGLLRREVVLTSAKAKLGMESVFEAIIDRIPSPQGKKGFSDLKQLPLMHPDSPERKAAEEALVPLRALLFDCWTSQSSGLQGGGQRTEASAASSSSSSGSAGASASSSSSGAAGTAMLIDATGVAISDDGVYCLVRVVDGTVTPGTVVTFFHSRNRLEVQEVGILHPSLHPTAALTAGMVGYVFLPGLAKKDILVGDTMCTVPSRAFTLASLSAASKGNATDRNGSRRTRLETEDESEEEKEKSDGVETTVTNAVDPFLIQPIPGFKQVQPVVFGGFFPDEGEMITQLREAVEALCINDPSVTVEPLQCQALGAGLQLGFLGLLHMQVFKERLLSEFGQNVLVTPPQVQYMCTEHGADPEDERQRLPLTVQNWRWPHEGIAVYMEPIVHATILTPKEYFNPINQAALTLFRGEQEDMRVVDDARILVRYRMPLADLARGFFMTVKSASHGYASLDYDDAVYTPADLVKVDIVINKAKISALSLICPRHESHEHGKRILRSLKDNLLRSSVDLPLQATVGNKIIARETIKAYRKDVTAKIHAGDISRKQKKWNDQKKGKERMARRSIGTVTLDQTVLAAAMGATTMK